VFRIGATVADYDMKSRWMRFSGKDNTTVWPNVSGPSR
jgi:hypothetical protein